MEFFNHGAFEKEGAMRFAEELQSRKRNFANISPLGTEEEVSVVLGDSSQARRQGCHI
jgi:hypothetical protein